MDAVQPLSTSLQQGLLATMLALSLLTIAWLGKRAFTREAEFAATLDRLNEARLKDIQAANAAHLATAMIVAPLAAKVTECITLLDRMLTAQQRPSP